MTILHQIKTKWFGGAFVRNLMILVSGTTVAQAIPILISPLLTRLYSPEDFGVLGLFLALSTTFGTIAAGRYEVALLLPESDAEAFNLAAVCLVFAACLSLLLLLALLLFHQPIMQLLHLEKIGRWIFLLPFTVFLIGLYNTLTYLNLRDKQYKTIAGATVFRSLGGAIMQVAAGLLNPGAYGLIGGHVLSNLLGNRKLLGGLRRHGKSRELLASVNRTEMRRLGKEYANFPKYAIWAVLANTLGQNLNNLVISTLFSMSTLGFYSLVNRMLGLPTALIGDAIGQVFLKEARDEKARTGHVLPIVKTTLLRLLLISLPVFAAVYLVVEDLVALVFGENWRIAGTYARILTPLFLVRFVAVPISLTLNLFDKQRMSLLWQIGFLLLVILVSALACIYALPVEAFLHLLTWTLVLHYLLLLYLSVRAGSRRADAEDTQSHSAF